MANSDPFPSKDIHKVTYDILKQSRSFDIFPTPVEKIVAFAELSVDHKNGLHKIPNHYISKKIDILVAGLGKVFGALDRRTKIIYLNPELLDVKKNFVKLHETGHHSLPWQRAVFEHVEDEKNLSPDIQEAFEAEANFFASAMLFQMNRFEDLARKLPLELKSARFLARHFGASVHATIRRYVETTHKRCGLIVLTKDTIYRDKLFLRNYFQSPPFTKDFGDLIMPAEFGIEWPFVQDYFINRKVIDNPQTIDFGSLEINNRFEYQYFYNGYNIFVFLTLKGERINSKTKIIIGV